MTFWWENGDGYEVRVDHITGDPVGIDTICDGCAAGGRTAARTPPRLSSTRSNSATRCDGKHGFRSTADICTATARVWMSRLQFAVRPITGIWRVRGASRKAAARSNPLIPGRLMSVTTTFAPPVVATGSAARPSVTPRTSYPAASRYSMYPESALRSSSTRRTGPSWRAGIAGRAAIPIPPKTPERGSALRGVLGGIRQQLTELSCGAERALDLARRRRQAAVLRLRRRARWHE